MPSAPGMFCTTMFGLPGRCLAIAAAIMRPAVSVPPPGGGPIIMVMVLPSNETGACAKAVAHSASVAATAHDQTFHFRLPERSARAVSLRVPVLRAVLVPCA